MLFANTVSCKTRPIDRGHKPLFQRHANGNQANICTNKTREFVYMDVAGFLHGVKPVAATIGRARVSDSQQDSVTSQ